jgi:hypothetical protein
LIDSEEFAGRGLRYGLSSPFYQHQSHDFHQRKGKGLAFFLSFFLLTNLPTNQPSKAPTTNAPIVPPTIAPTAAPFFMTSGNVSPVVTAKHSTPLKLCPA